ncbi:hypothetical protein KM043_017931 [Ampulex compressa]|nr:hypothetical protein KM043_017931 [Ampulex compressa]
MESKFGIKKLKEISIDRENDVELHVSKSQGESRLNRQKILNIYCYGTIFDRYKLKFFIFFLFVALITCTLLSTTIYLQKTVATDEEMLGEDFEQNLNDILEKTIYKRSKRDESSARNCEENCEQCKILLEPLRFILKDENGAREIQEIFENLQKENSTSILKNIADCLKCRKCISGSSTTKNTDNATFLYKLNDDNFQKISVDSKNNSNNKSNNISGSSTTKNTDNATLLYKLNDDNFQKIPIDAKNNSNNKSINKTVNTNSPDNNITFVDKYTNDRNKSEEKATYNSVNIIEKGKGKNSTNERHFEESANPDSEIVVFEDQRFPFDGLTANEDNSRNSDGRIVLNDNFQAKGSFEPTQITDPTAETIKTSQQLQLTPSMSWMPYPVCFYGPSPKQINQINDPASGFGANYGFSAASPLQSPISPGFMQAPSMQFRPPQGPNFFQDPHKFGPSGPVLQNHHGFPSQHAAGKTMPYYCTYIPAPTFQFPTVPGMAEYRRSSNDTDGDSASRSFKGYPRVCPSNSIRCGDGGRCILKLQWCDGHVDCNDASDEISCSCRDRISKERLCDGYFDCPRGEDELGCSGCSKTSFSCEDWSSQHIVGNCVSLTQRCDGIRQCYNGKDEADCAILTPNYVEATDIFTIGYTEGYLHKNLNGQWYPVCSKMMAWAIDACISEIGLEIRGKPEIQMKTLPNNSYKGLYIMDVEGVPRIVKSCSNTMTYVRCPRPPCGTRSSYRFHSNDSVSASTEENDLEKFETNANFETDLKQNDSSDINSESSSNQKYDNYEDKENYEKGSKSILNQGNDWWEKDKNVNTGLTENQNSKPNLNGNEDLREEWKLYGSEKNEETQENKNPEVNLGVSNDSLVGSELRVVGGRASRPKAWPFLVAIYKDGKFHCGGVILNEWWILTAAHCLDGHAGHYYEVQAGMLRRYSFSPMGQSRRVRYTVLHPRYDGQDMKNDIGLLMVDQRLMFNRWVNAACLPGLSTAGTYWRRGPPAGDMCMAIGWGATREHGPDPDHLREVEVPILSYCKHLSDQNDAAICAGYPQGGRDACQGDSGGPLMCRNPNQQSQWYVAGIVSHGEGCGRPDEPGAYTKVSQFVEWIRQTSGTQTVSPIGNLPLSKCPGFRCAGGSGRCLPIEKRCNRMVDCLNAEDEINCHSSTNYYGVYRQSNVNQETSMSTENVSDVTEESVGSYGYTENSTPIILTEESLPATSSTNLLPVSSTDYLNNDDAESLLGAPMITATFTCTRLMQSIPMSERCDRILNCEDGSDEANCTCKEFLINLRPSAICNGLVDCYDGTDEADCELSAASSMIDKQILERENRTKLNNSNNNSKVFTHDYNN